MTHYKMSDVAVEVNDRENNPASSKYDRFVGLEHYVSGEVIIRNYGSTENLESTMKIFQSGDVLVARRNVYLKRASMVDFDGLTSGDSIVLRAKDPVIGRILPFVLNTDAFWDFADQYSDGTMSKRLSPKTLMTYEFDLPDEEELEKFADLLWAANDTRESYQALLRQTDELVKSQFIELFGLYLKHTVPLKNVCIKGPQNGFYRKGSEVDGVTPIMKMKQLFGNEAMCEASDCDKVLLTDTELSRFCLTENDLLFGRRSLVVEGAGKCRRVGAIREDAVFESSMLRVTLDPKRVRARYLQQWFDSEDGVNAIISIRAVTTIAGIKGSDLANIEVPVPPMKLQDEFLAFLEQTDKSKYYEQNRIFSVTRGGELCA